MLEFLIKFLTSYHKPTKGQNAVFESAAKNPTGSLSAMESEKNVAAPDLFNCVTDPLMTCACQQNLRVQVGSYCLMDLEYVGDIILFSNMATDLDAGLNVFRESWVLKLARKKKQGNTHQRGPRSTAHNHW